MRISYLDSLQYNGSPKGSRSGGETTGGWEGAEGQKRELCLTAECPLKSGKRGQLEGHYFSAMTETVNEAKLVDE